MRYTRNRQLYRLTKDKHWYDTYNVTIEFNNKWAPLGLDPTFKWHRGGTYMSWVEFKPNPKETRLIPAK
jgi:hypothetical protein